MYNYLIDHAIQNVWCNPDQDNQLLFQGSRLTKEFGELNRIKFLNRTLNLPQTGKRYSVYQIGQIPASSLGLLSNKVLWENEKWVKFSDALKDKKVFCQLYTKEGTILPIYNAYYMFSNERDLVFCIEHEKDIPISYLKDIVYLRVYSNAFFQTTQNNPDEYILFSQGRVIQNTEQIIDTQILVQNYRTKPGYIFCYVNGFLVDTISSVTTKIGDIVQLVYDSSVKKVVTFKVSDLPAFTSELDSKNKYLLHYLDENNSSLDYQDDIDIYIVNEYIENVYQGYYYHRNNVDSHRMVTHKDYSISVDYFDYISNELIKDQNKGQFNKRDFKLKVFIRKSGYNRPLIYDDLRIFELYKLSSSKILEAMVGVNSLQGVWNASNLEKSAYSQLMRVTSSEVNLDLVQKAYGYNGMSKVLGNTPSKTYLASGRQVADLPYALQNYSTAYEYDINGHLLGYYLHVNGTNYEAQNSATHLVEMIRGKGSDELDIVIGQDDLPLPLYDSYRVYRCFLNQEGVPNEKWSDITGSSEYRITNNRLFTTREQYDHVYMIRTDKDFLAYDLDIEPVNGNLFFSLSEVRTVQNTKQTFILSVPLGELDVFLNGKSLIKGLDYIVQFPKIMIINKKYLKYPVQTNQQKIHVRFTGFCDEELNLDPIEDFGFIQHGFLSNNSRFDIRDDKVLRITVDGKCIHRDALEFSENHDGISITDIDNGKPYQIKDIVVPLKNLVNQNTYSLRKKSIEIDSKISDYMTIKLPQALRNAPSAIPELYPLVSPFINRLVHELETNTIKENEINLLKNDNQIIEFIKEYEDLLDFDPILSQINNMKYLAIHPHNENSVKNLSVTKYRFLKKAIDLYAKDVVNINSHVAVA